MKLTRLAIDLILWDDDLTGAGITGVLDGVAQDADDPDHLAHLFYPVFHVAGVTDELLTAGNLEQDGDRLYGIQSSGGIQVV